MRIRSLLVAVATVLLVCLSLWLTQKTDSQTNSNSVGLRSTVLTTPRGTVKVYLPSDIAAGDMISGTVMAEPAGKNDKEKERNTGVLNGYVIDFGGKKSPVSGGILNKITIAPQITSQTNLILVDEKGKSIATAIIPVAQSGANVPSAFRVFAVAQAGAPMTIHGPFDGDAANTRVNIGGTDAKMLAESPRGAVCQSPANVVGETKVEVIENGATHAGQFRNLKIDLTAPKTSLRRGESTELHVEVTGLSGLQQTIPIQLTNNTPANINLSGGNVQTIPIQPSQVQTGGTYSWNGTVTGTSSGGFSINATIPTGPTVASGPASTPTPPPQTTPPPSTVPSPVLSDTVVQRPDPGPPSGGTGRIEIELIGLSLQGGRPIPVAQGEVTAPAMPEPSPIESPELRPPTGLETPEPSPPPRHTASPPPMVPTTTPTISGSGKRVIPTPPPKPGARPPVDCACEKVTVNVDDDPSHQSRFDVTKSDQVSENGQYVGFKAQALLTNVPHTIACLGDPGTRPCRAEVTWKIEVKVAFKKNNSTWSNSDTDAEVLVTDGGSVALSCKCRQGKNGAPNGCEETHSDTVTQNLTIRYPKALADGIKARKKGGPEIKTGDIEVTVTWTPYTDCKELSLTNKKIVTTTIKRGPKTLTGFVIKN